MAKKETKKPAPEKEPKEKKGKNKKGEEAATAPAPDPAAAAAGTPPTTSAPVDGVPPTGTPSIPLSALPPEQMNLQQIEQAIKESNDPESRLKKLRSPLNVKSCLLNILFLIILTLTIVIVWCAIAVDKFSFGTVVKDMSWQFGITQGFQWLWKTISGWFGGGK